jgi:hypothetical protein
MHRSPPSRLRLATALVVALAWFAAAAAVLAQSPTASPVGGDPRSSGEGPGLVGDPLLAIGGVLVIAILAVGGTLAYIHFTGGPRRDSDRR